MRIIKESRIKEYIARHADAKSALENWVFLMRDGAWTNIDQLHKVFPSADGVRVRSGRTATVFNIGGNKCRLVTAIHYNAQRVFVMRFLTHAQYSKDTWQDNL